MRSGPLQVLPIPLGEAVLSAYKPSDLVTWGTLAFPEATAPLYQSMWVPGSDVCGSPFKWPSVPCTHTFSS